MSDEEGSGKCPGANGESRVTYSRALRFWLDPANLAVKLRRAGPVVRTKNGPAVAFQMNDPSLIRKVGCTEDTFQFWGADPSLREVAGRGLPGSEGQAHRDRRAVMRPALSAPHLTDLGTSVWSRARGLLAEIPADRPVDMRFEMGRLVSGLVAECVLNSALSSDTLSALSRARSALSGGMIWKYALAPWPWVPVPRQRAFRRAVATLHEAAREVYDRHQPSPDGGDVVSLLKRASGDDQDVVLHDLHALLLAGIEATTGTLAWSCYELGRHPEHQEALRAEADALLGPEASADAVRTDLMPRTTGFIREVTRMHGIPFLVRRTRHATCLGGQTVPARAVVTLPLGALRRDPARYARPDDFDPLRWSPDASPPLSPNALFAYGLGPRYCPGAAVADILVPVALASLVHARTLRMARPGGTVRVSLELTPTPRGLSMVAAPREPSPVRPPGRSVPDRSVPDRSRRTNHPRPTPLSESDPL
ncbi:cytochrome P450 [Streptomyces sp. PTY087I2]|uniref:cytochrome P450 n=1 Tax=Streptomyces sp. PTY087I2 TaxID=1819298 RepID=UPI00080B8979|nr:cytochrome P450 [Streptomyces sp. PTY087I2]OCC09734.1 Epi-isozizaene 5-monooxygenase/(E)-beta-farnesene synthase [Streptomyces sp. PTY087I2]